MTEQRAAERPTDLSGDDWKDVTKRVVARIKEDQIVLLGAGAAFFGLLSLIPAMIAAVSIYGLVSNPADVQRQINDLTGSLPASAKDLLAEQLDSIVSSSSGSLSIGLVIGLGVALWSASSGISNLIGALNVAYHEPESRGFVKLRGMSLFLTVGAIVFAIAAISAIAVLPALTDGSAIDGGVATAVSVLRWPLLLTGFMAALAVLYKVGPDRQDARISWVSWGAGFATVVWVVASALFSFYVGRFSSYNETYGSLAGVIVLMLWLLLTSVIVIVGAVINAELELQTPADTTTGALRSAGARDAVVADNVHRGAEPADDADLRDPTPTDDPAPTSDHSEPGRSGREPEPHEVS